jgi:hypothetical protein
MIDIISKHLLKAPQEPLHSDITVSNELDPEPVHPDARMITAS